MYIYIHIYTYIYIYIRIHIYIYVYIYICIYVFTYIYIYIHTYIYIYRLYRTYVFNSVHIQPSDVCVVISYDVIWGNIRNHRDVQIGDLWHANSRFSWNFWAILSDARWSADTACTQTCLRSFPAKHPPTGWPSIPYFHMQLPSKGCPLQWQTGATWVSTLVPKLWREVASGNLRWICLRSWPKLWNQMRALFVIFGVSWCRFAIQLCTGCTLFFPNLASEHFLKILKSGHFFICPLAQDSPSVESIAPILQVQGSCQAIGMDPQLWGWAMASLWAAWREVPFRHTPWIFAGSKNSNRRQEMYSKYT